MPSNNEMSVNQSLSQRELGVLRLVAEFKTDQQIADELCISVRTVNAHVASILAKIGVDDRREAARWFWENK